MRHGTDNLFKFEYIVTATRERPMDDIQYWQHGQHGGARGLPRAANGGTRRVGVRAGTHAGGASEASVSPRGSFVVARRHGALGGDGLATRLGERLLLA